MSEVNNAGSLTPGISPSKKDFFLRHYSIDNLNPLTSPISIFTQLTPPVDLILGGTNHSSHDCPDPHRHWCTFILFNGLFLYGVV